MGPLSEKAKVLAIAAKRAIGAAEDAELPPSSPVRLTDEERAHRLAELLATSGFDVISWEDLRVLSNGDWENDPLEDSDEWFRWWAARTAHLWREIQHDIWWRESIPPETLRNLMPIDEDRLVWHERITPLFKQLDEERGTHYFAEHRKRFEQWKRGDVGKRRVIYDYSQPEPEEPRQVPQRDALTDRELWLEYRRNQ
jgi:hypothetical protein